MQEEDNLLNRMNKVKALADELACLEERMKNEDVVMILLQSLSPSHEHLIITLETILMKELIMEYVLACLMYNMSDIFMLMTVKISISVKRKYEIT